jgi:hypothetical protein
MPASSPGWSGLAPRAFFMRMLPEDFAAERARLVVAIPAKNEARLLPRCLRALAAQRGAPPFDAVVFANDCTDATAPAARSLATQLPGRLRVIEASLAPAQRHAGQARRCAMEAAAADATEDAILFSTDADAVPDPQWIANTMRHFAAGVEAVAGHAILEPLSSARLPHAVRERCRQEALVARLLARIETLIDPLPWDPWPSHRGHWGANFAVTRAAYLRAGGIPPVPLAEDRAFFAALDRADARIRHAHDSIVHVSARAIGRAPGGMADVLARRATQDDPLCDALIEPVGVALRRFRLRRALREGRDLTAPRIARRLRMAPDAIAQATNGRCDGAAWAALRALSPSLAEHRLPRDRLAREIAAARRVILRLADDPDDDWAPIGDSLV